ncbi:MAG: cytochrome c biogenesis protein CcsA, partial [Allosphingosinicella sp.]
MHIFANPARFLKIARPLTGWLGWGGGALIIGALFVGLFVAPRDYLQGESVRIMYIHVPAAWLGMAGWAGLAAAGLMQLVWRHPLAAVAGRAVALPGAVFTAICLVTATASFAAPSNHEAPKSSPEAADGKLGVATLSAVVAANGTIQRGA